MNITQINQTGLQREYRVVIPAVAFSTKVSEHLKSLGGNLRIAGFRQGKVPLSLVKQRYGETALTDAAQDFVRSSVDQLLAEHKLKPALKPRVIMETLKEGEDFSFQVFVEETPQVEIQSMDGITLDRFIVTVTDKEVRGQLTKIAKEKKVPVSLEASRPAEKGDLLLLSMEGKLPNGQVLEIDKEQKIPLHLGSKVFGEELEEALMGACAGDVREVSINLPKGYPAKKLAGKEAILSVTLHDVQVYKHLPVGEELARALGFDSLAALQEQVKKNLEQEHENLARLYMKRQLLDQFAEQYQFDVPPGMVEAEFNIVWQQLQAALEKSQNREEVLGEDVGLSEPDLKEEYRRVAERRVRLGLVLAAVGHKNKIEVTSKDLEQAVVQEMQNNPGQSKQIADYYQKNQQAALYLKATIFEERVVDYILGVVKTIETPISAQGLVEKVESL